MSCPYCGEQITEGATFCGSCGKPLGLPEVDATRSPTKRAPAGMAAERQPAVTRFAAPPPPVADSPPPPPAPGPPAPSGTTRTLWILIAILAAAVVIVAAVLTYLLVRGDDGQVTTTTAATTAPSSTIAPTSTTGALQSTTTSLSTTTIVGGPPGDSVGEWVEVEVPGAFVNVYGAALSERALVVATSDDTGSKMYVYDFGSRSLSELPIDAVESGGPAIDGDLVVWWEGTFDEASGALSASHIYSFRLPDGPKIEIAGTDRNPGYPQVAGGLVTWIQSSPHETNPEEWREPIYGVLVDEAGRPVGEVEELVPSAIAYYLGDSTWSYGLSSSHLAWEQATADGGFETGTHVLDLATMQSSSLGTSAWRPSVAGDVVTFWSDGLKAYDAASSSIRTIDAAGDFPAAGPTFVAYFRPAPEAPSFYQIVARGYEGKKEQVLSDQAGPPWLSMPIAVSATHIAFVTDYHSILRLFEWRSE